jgi:hypothetical protein
MLHVAQAKALKVVESDLLKMGSEIARLIELKTQAVENEDYDRARMIRDDINRVRSSIHQRIAAAGLGGGTRGSASVRAAPRGPPVDPYDVRSHGRVCVCFDAGVCCVNVCVSVRWILVTGC